MRQISLVDINSHICQNRTALTRADVAPDHKWNFVQRRMTFDKDLRLQGLHRFHPFNTITIDKLDDVHMSS